MNSDPQHPLKKLGSGVHANNPSTGEAWGVLSSYSSLTIELQVQWESVSKKEKLIKPLNIDLWCAWVLHPKRSSFERNLEHLTTKTKNLSKSSEVTLQKH